MLLGTLDLCCGMGGLSYAAQKAGLTVWAGVDSSDSSISSYKENFPKALSIRGDISDDGVIEEYVGLVESERNYSKGLVVVSGPPCQGFSDAGPRRVDDPRNQVLVAVAKAIVRLGAEAALVENVSGLRKTRNSRVLSRFRGILNSAGYHIYSFQLDALDFGVPQKRLRVMYFITPFTLRRSTISDELRALHRPAKTVRKTIGDLPIPPVRPDRYDPAKDNGKLTNHFITLR